MLPQPTGHIRQSTNAWLRHDELLGRNANSRIETTPRTYMHSQAAMCRLHMIFITSNLMSTENTSTFTVPICFFSLFSLFGISLFLAFQHFLVWETSHFEKYENSAASFPFLFPFVVHQAHHPLYIPLYIYCLGFSPSPTHILKGAQQSIMAAVQSRQNDSSFRDLLA